MTSSQACPDLLGDQPPEIHRRRAYYGDAPGPKAPKYVHACYRQAWTLRLWPSTEDGQSTHVLAPFRCKSWRHDGPCRRDRVQQDYARIKEAFDPYDKGHITYLVLTLDPMAWTAHGWDPDRAKSLPRDPNANRDKRSRYAAFRGLCAAFSRLMSRIRRLVGPCLYVCTVETHKSGWPHLNVLLVSDRLAQLVSLARKAIPRIWSRKATAVSVAKRVLGDHVVGSGFGPRAWLEGARDRDAIVGYIAKLAAGMGGAFDGASPAGLVESLEGHQVGEVIKDSQVPEHAPPHFRRLRASIRFLPPCQRREGWSGELLDETGQPIARLPKTLEAMALASDLYRAVNMIGHVSFDRARALDCADRIRDASTVFPSGESLDVLGLRILPRAPPVLVLDPVRLYTIRAFDRDNATHLGPPMREPMLTLHMDFTASAADRVRCLWNDVS